jgi:hypothetical protein
MLPKGIILYIHPMGGNSMHAPQWDYPSNEGNSMHAPQ